MKKDYRVSTLALIAAAATLSYVTFGPPPSESFDALVDRMEHSVVAIEATTDEEGHAALGAGTFITDDGLISTNFHVIEGMKDEDSVYIKAKGNSKAWEASVVAADPQTDLALIRIDEWNDFKKQVPYRVAHIAPSHSVKPGEEVWAVGMPAGFFWTVTKGFLSANDRKMLPIEPNYYIQADLRITNGNSGGPLFDRAGNMIGINNMIRVVQGGNIPFAIPSEIIQKVVRALRVKEDKVVWPKLGIAFEPAPDGVGMRIKEISDDSGLKGIAHKGWTIVSVSTKYQPSTTLVDDVQLQDAIVVLDVGDYVKMRILDRKQEIHDVNVKLYAGKTSEEYAADVQKAFEEHQQPGSEGEEDNR